jgi:hypothetical protein
MKIKTVKFLVVPLLDPSPKHSVVNSLDPCSSLNMGNRHSHPNVRFQMANGRQTILTFVAAIILRI